MKLYIKKINDTRYEVWVSKNKFDWVIAEFYGGTAYEDAKLFKDLKEEQREQMEISCQ